MNLRLIIRIKIFTSVMTLCKYLWAKAANVLDFILFCLVPSKCSIFVHWLAVSFSSFGKVGLDLGLAPLDEEDWAWGWVEGGGGGVGGHNIYWGLSV